MSKGRSGPVGDQSIPAVYNEFETDEDSTIPLRTIVEFELFDKITGELVPFDGLSDQTRHISLKGFLLEPLPRRWRDTVLGLCSTTPYELIDKNIDTLGPPKKKADTPDQEGTEDSVPTESVVSEPQTIDWEALKVGDTVDGYCTQTFKWYEAKIIQHDVERLRYKVHFQGWNSKYDEWLPKFSERLVPFHTSKEVMRQAVEHASRMVPWYQYAQLIKRAQEVMGGQKFPSRQPLYVCIDRVDDWCIDYTYASPTLWIISGEIWYRVAGPLCPGGSFGSPAEGYRNVFLPALEKYLAAAHISMILLDQIPVNSTVSFQAVVEEASRRSLGMVNEVNVLEIYQFLVDQLSTIALPEEWDSKKSIVKSLFMTQLKKEGEAFLAAGGLTALNDGSYKGSSSKRRLSICKQYNACLVELSHGHLSETQAALMQLEFVGEDLDNKGKKPRKSASAAPRKKALKIEYPYEDSMVWEADFVNAKIKSSLLPMPRQSWQMLRGMDKDDNPALFHHQSLLLSIAATLTNFRELLKIPMFQLHDLEHAVACGDIVHPLLRTISVALLETVIRCYVQDGVIKLRQVLGEERAKANEDEEEDTKDCRQPFVLEAAQTPEQLYKFLNTGDAWIEVGKIICERIHFSALDLHLSGPIDPMSACEELFKEMMNKFKVLPFATPIDPDVHGLHDYLDLIEEPMDFNTIKLRLLTGWYFPRETSSLQSLVDDDDKPASDASCASEVGDRLTRLLRPKDGLYQVGQMVDVYDEGLKRWVEGVVVDREIASSNSNHPLAVEVPTVTAYCIRRIGYGSGSLLRVEIGDDRVIEHKSASAERFRRAMPPTELFQKFPQYAPVDVALQENYVSHDSNFSRHRGHEGFARDMRLVWDNCVRYYTHSGELENNDFVQEAELMKEYFESRYTSRVLRFSAQTHMDVLDRLFPDTLPQSYFRPVETWKLALKAMENGESRETLREIIPELEMPEDTELLMLLVDMKRRSFLAQPTQNKLVFLHWLCQCFVDTDTVHEYLSSSGALQKSLPPLKQAMEAKELMNRRNSSSNDLEIVSGSDDEGVEDDSFEQPTSDKASETGAGTGKSRKSLSKSSSRASLGSLDEKANPTTPSTGKKRKREESATPTAAASENGSSGSATKTPAKKRGRPSIQAQMEQAATTPATPAAATPAAVVAMQPSVLFRHNMLGTDRMGNRYWSFARAMTEQPTIFCEMRSVTALPTHLYTLTVHRAPAWILYSAPGDLLQLVQHLDERGTQEALLLRGVMEWLNEHRVALPFDPADIIVPAAASTADDANGADGTAAANGKKEKFVRRSEERWTYEVVQKWKQMGCETDATMSSYLASTSTAADKMNNDLRTLRHKMFQTLNDKDHKVYAFRVLFTKAAKQLGMGVKAGNDDWVYVSSFAPQSICKAAGFRMGDRLLMAGNTWRPSVTQLVSMVRACAQACETDDSSATPQYMTFLVRRSTVPHSDSSFAAMLEKDKDIKTHYHQQQDEMQQQLQQARGLSSASLASYLVDIPGQFNSLVTSVLDLLERLHHPAYTSEAWRHRWHPLWCSKILEVMCDTQNLDNQGSVLVWYLTRLVVDLEQELYHFGTVLRDDWMSSPLSSLASGILGLTTSTSSSATNSSSANNNNGSGVNATSTTAMSADMLVHGCQSRSRRMWLTRSDVDTCVYPEQLAYLIAQLSQAIDWDLCRQLITPVSRDRMAPLLRQYGLDDTDSWYHSLQQVGARVMYFSDGHAAAIEADCNPQSTASYSLFTQRMNASCRTAFQLSKLSSLSSSSSSSSGSSSSAVSAYTSPALAYRRGFSIWANSHRPQPGTVLLCEVLSSQLFAPASSVVPFVSITLNILTMAPQNNALFPAPSKTLTAPNQRPALARQLLRIHNLLKKCNHYKPFLEPVNVDEYPTYPEIVKKPIDLTMIEKRITAQSYTSTAAYLDDLELMYENCCAFCGADSKKLPPLAKGIWEDAQHLCDEFFPPQPSEDDNVASDDDDKIDDTAMDVDEEDDDANVTSPQKKQRGRPARRQSLRSGADSTSTAAAAEGNSSSGKKKDQGKVKAEATPAAAAATAPKTIQVCVRLDRVWPRFLVTQDVYHRNLKVWNASMATMDKAAVRMEYGTDRQGNPRYALGTVVGSKDPVSAGRAGSCAARVMPWEFVQVDWQEPAEALLPEFVNSWEVTLLPSGLPK